MPRPSTDEGPVGADAAVMSYAQLLCSHRIGEPGDDGRGRDPFERDVSRVLFSNSFRRLHNKTQVFPVPENDHVHSRLTHSLEVADVGEGLGRAAGRVLIQRHRLSQVDAAAFGSIVRVACLAHDLGNPPFGHAGEDAIGHYFTHGPGARYTAALSPAEADDVRNFEGNAQGFRILVRLGMQRPGGMRLTAASLAAFGKYPQGVQHRGDRQRVGGKKFGYFHSESEVFAAVAAACGLLSVAERPGAWQRHPLAYLMEAADDICYNILDLEDGVMLGLIDQASCCRLLAPLCGGSEAELQARPVAQLRASAIGRLVDEVLEIFLAHDRDLLAGTMPGTLADLIPSREALAAIGAENMRRCYRSDIALDLEQTGFNVIGNLLDNLCSAIFDGRHARLQNILPQPPAADASDYDKILSITDYVSGMTDRYALRRYQGWNGIRLRSV